MISGETEDIHQQSARLSTHGKRGRTTVHTFTAPDPEGTAISWTLDGADKDVFGITGGVLVFSTPPNYEQPGDVGGNNVYNITIKATDNTNNSGTLPGNRQGRWTSTKTPSLPRRRTLAT